MIGLDVVGLALSVFPVVVQIIEFYNGSVRTRDIYYLAESLKNREQIFRNTVEELLRSTTIPQAQLYTLLRNPRDDLWKDASIDEKVMDHLGPQAEELMRTTKDIFKVLDQLKKNLPVLNTTSPQDLKTLPKIKLVMKSFLKGPKNKASLEMLTARVEEFRILAGQNIGLAPLRCSLPKSLQNLRQVQQSARGLYQALRVGWECDCKEEHRANLKLEVWQPQPGDQDDEAVKFRFLFFFNAAAVDAKLEDWKTAELVALDNGADADVFRGSQGRPGIVAPFSNDADPEAASDLSSTGQSNLPRSSSRVTFDLPPPRTENPLEIDEQEAKEKIPDLCDFLKGLHDGDISARSCLGHITDARGHKYGLFTTPESVCSRPGFTCLNLGEIFSQPTRTPSPITEKPSQTPKTANLSSKTRIELALVLGWNVLQLYSTHWLEDHWTKDNILLVIDPPNMPQPYVAHGFQSSRRGSTSSLDSTLGKSDRARFTKWARIEALYTLGVILLEICYNQSLEELAEQNENPFMTAMRLQKDVHNQLGCKYAEAVAACLHCDFGTKIEDRSADLGNEQLQKSVWQHIIKPLQEAAGSFGSIITAASSLRLSSR